MKIPTIKFSPSYEKKEYDPEVPANLINSKVGVGTNENAGEHQLVFFEKKVFNYPKPTSLIKYLLSFNDDRQTPFIVMDFFSGSGTTGEAVLELNNIERRNRIKYILVQLPEDLNASFQQASSPSQKEIIGNAINLCCKLNYSPCLTEIAKERIRRAGAKIITEQKSKNDGLFAEETPKLDVGFKVFKLDSSNVNAWDSNPENLEAALNNSLFNIKEDRTEDDLLYEILIKYGIELTEKINHHTIAGKTVYEMGAGSLIVCLADNITTDVAEGVGKLWNEVRAEDENVKCRMVFKDSGFNGSDEMKTNTMLILKQHGITNVASV